MNAKWAIQSGVLLALSSFALAAQAEEAASIIATASKALGVDRLDSVEFAGSGADFALGQAYRPDVPWPKFTLKSYRRGIDLRASATRLERVRTQAENPPRGGGGQPIRSEQQQVQNVDAQSSWTQQLDVWLAPQAFLRAAAAARDSSAKEHTHGGKRVQIVSFTAQNKARVEGYINERHQVEKIVTAIDNPFFGDLAWETSFGDYKSFDGIAFPTRIAQRQGGYPTLELYISDVKPNAAVKVEPSTPPAAQSAASEQLGDGVYLIKGGYASIAVDFKDHIVVLEGGQSEARGLAVIAETKRLIPGKPIRYIVNTHHHVDHSSGLRPFVADGATIITHEVNKDYFTKVLAAPHSLNPDLLEKSPRKTTIETVGSKKVLTDGNHVVELHHLADNGHNAGLLIAYLPKEKVLFQADAYNPPAKADEPLPQPPSAFTVNLAANIERLKLDVERIIPVHYPPDGRVVTKAELWRAAGRDVAVAAAN